MRHFCRNGRRLVGLPPRRHNGSVTTNDRLRVLILGSIPMSAAAYALYTVPLTRPDLLVPLYGLAGLTVGVTTAVPYLVVQAFPPAVSFTGVSFSYNVAFAVFGGLTPLFVQLALRVDGQAPAHYMLFIAALGIILGLSTGRGVR